MFLTQIRTITNYQIWVSATEVRYQVVKVNKIAPQICYSIKLIFLHILGLQLLAPLKLYLHSRLKKNISKALIL